MSSDAVFSAVKAFLDAEWTATSLCYENETFDLPQPPAAFVLVEMYADFDQQITIGTGSPTTEVWRESGAVLLHVMVPTGTGSLTARQHATALADLFRGRLLAGETIRFYDLSIGLGGPGSEDGTYWRLTVRADFLRN